MASAESHPVRSLMQSALLAGAMVCAGAASAAPPHERYSSTRHSGDAPYYAWVDVVHVDPIVHVDYVEEPVERCYETRRRDRSRYRTAHRDRGHHDRGRGRSDPGAVLLGGAIGGLIGNQFGGGNGKRALTVAGAVIGASVAANASARHRDHDRYQRRHGRDEPVRRCDVTYEERPVERIEGYEVTYRYHGRRFTRVVDSHPGDRMRVRVDVQPVA